MTEHNQRTRDVFATLADTLVDDFDVIEFLDMFTERCVELLGVTAAGVLLVDHAGTVNLVGASSEPARRLQRAQLRHHAGPGLDAFSLGQVVRSTDLSDTQWPRFALTATDAGFAAVHALPMRLRAEMLGGLCLYTSVPGAIDEERAGLAQALADTATIGILQHRTIRHHATVAEQLKTALDSRVLIEQAKGMLAERLHVPVSTAFTLLRTYARNTSQRLSDVASTVVNGSADTSDLTGVPKVSTAG